MIQDLPLLENHQLLKTLDQQLLQLQTGKAKVYLYEITKLEVGNLQVVSD